MTTRKGQLSSFELEARYEAAADPIGESHFHALWLLSLGYEVEVVAELLSFTPRWVRSLSKRYKEEGPDLTAMMRGHYAYYGFHLQAQPLASLARARRMIFRTEEDFDRALDGFAKVRRAWPLYLAWSARLSSPVIGNRDDRRSKVNPRHWARVWREHLPGRKTVLEFPFPHLLSEWPGPPLLQAHRLRRTDDERGFRDIC